MRGLWPSAAAQHRTIHPSIRWVSHKKFIRRIIALFTMTRTKWGTVAVDLMNEEFASSKQWHDDTTGTRRTHSTPVTDKWRHEDNPRLRQTRYQDAGRIQLPKNRVGSVRAILNTVLKNLRILLKPENSVTIYRLPAAPYTLQRLYTSHTSFHPIQLPECMECQAPDKNTGIQRTGPTSTTRRGYKQTN